MSLLAIDHGTSKCGLAIEIAGIALPLWTVPTKDIVGRLKTIVSERNIDTIIIGIAKHVNGQPSKQSALQRTFAGRISSYFPDCQVILWDERFTTSEARLSLEETGSNWNGNIDDMAASILLQSYLEARS